MLATSRFLVLICGEAFCDMPDDDMYVETPVGK
jgi:hypothetical protein